MVKTSSMFSRTGRKKKPPHKAASADSTLPTDTTLVDSTAASATAATAAEMPATSLGASPRKPPPRLASIATTTALALSLPTRSISATSKQLMAAGASGAWCVWYENLAEAERAELLASIMELGNDMLKQTYEATDQVRALGLAGRCCTPYPQCPRDAAGRAWLRTLPAMPSRRGVPQLIPLICPHRSRRTT